MVSFEEAREIIARRLRALPPPPTVEAVRLEECIGRVLAADVAADRDYPPFHRSTRDGFAVRSDDVRSLPATLRTVGEARAGAAFSGRVEAGQCVRIMTGAPVPEGADAVVMVEFATVSGEEVGIRRLPKPQENIVFRGTEARQGDVQLGAGSRLGYAEVGVLAQVGCMQVEVFRRPRVAVLSTGDEVVPATEVPGPIQIRNSNSYSLAAQVRLAGGEPVPLGNVGDNLEDHERAIRKGLESDLVVITGGVSMGEYDLVEDVLRKLGAEILFDAVAIRPGKPAVFARCGERLVFGLPGNPLSTMVTFEIFVRQAVAALSGAQPAELPFLNARLQQDYAQELSLMCFVPAVLERQAGEVWARPLPWKGSGDVSGLVQGDCFVLFPPDGGKIRAGTWVQCLPRLGKDSW